jgi:DNA polymerase bacteriophage-type
VLKYCFIDTETRGKVNLNAEGLDRYARSVQCTVVTWALGDETVRIWDVLDEPRVPPHLMQQWKDPEVVFVAQNAPFDIEVLTRTFGHLPASRFWDTRTQSYGHSLPGNLELMAQVVGVPVDLQKIADGSRLIQIFCVPQGADEHFISPYDMPEEWERFKQYAIRDVETLREVFKRLPTHNYNYRSGTVQLWHLDQKINRRGYRLDAPFARECVAFLKTAKEERDLAVSKATDGAVKAVTQREKLLDYLQVKLGLDIPNMRAAELRAALESEELSPEARFLIEARLDGAKSSGAKYRRGLDTMGPDDRIRYGIQMNAAGRTGRWGGKGFQVHNTPRPVMLVRRTTGPRAGRVEQMPVKASYIDEVILPGIASRAALNNPEVYGSPNEATSMAVRHAIIAAQGNELVVWDWSNIESRILAWIADEDWKLRAYEAVDRGEGEDLYKLLFASFFGGDPGEVNDNERQSGKVSELAFGFGGGVGALVTMAATYQMDLDPLADLVLPRASEIQLAKALRAWRRAFRRGEDYLLEPRTYMACDVLKQSYRSSNAAINQLRHDLDVSIKTAVGTPGRAFKVGKCLIWSTGNALMIQLPSESERRLIYYSPAIEYEFDIDDETGEKITYPFITFSTARHKMWKREKAWSGLFLENIVQAIANEILRGALTRIDQDTWRVPAVEKYLLTLPLAEQTAIALHVHDEGVLDVPKNSYPLERAIRIATAGESWSGGLPLHVNGWTGPRYGKR